MVSLALLTVSDTRDIKNDDSGQFLVDSVKIDKHNISNRIICKDNVYIIRKHISDWIADNEIDVIITTGGTGLTFTDVTPEAIKPLLDKEIEGFAEIFRYTSFKKIGTSTLQSRCIAGVANGTFIFSLPGSLDAVNTAWNQIIKYQLNSDTKPCNLINLINRLKK
mgnify:FL=1